MLERPDKSVGPERFATGHALRVVGQAVPRAILAPVVPEPHEGLLVAGGPADLTATALACRWMRRCARLLSGHRRLTLLWSRPFGCLLGRLTRGAVTFLYVRSLSKIT